VFSCLGLHSILFTRSVKQRQCGKLTSLTDSQHVSVTGLWGATLMKRQQALRSVKSTSQHLPSWTNVVRLYNRLCCYTVVLVVVAMAPVLMQRSVVPSRTLCRVPFTAHASLKAGRGSMPREEENKPGHALLAAALTASMLMGAGLVIPEQAHAAGSAGRASANKFRSRR